MTEKIKNEIIERLEILESQGMRMDTDVIEMMKEKEEMCLSEGCVLLGQTLGLIYPLNENVQCKKVVDEIAKENNFVPYFCLLGKTDLLGPVLSVLYVSANESFWENERAELLMQSPCAYVYNFNEDFGEVGYIRYDMFCGGPIRIG